MWLLLNKLHKVETLEGFREGKGPESFPRLHGEGKFNLNFKEQKKLQQAERRTAIPDIAVTGVQVKGEKVGIKIGKIC